MPVRPHTHKPPGSRSRAEVSKQTDAQRGSSTERGYGHRWQKARAGFLSKHPLCAACARDGRVVVATVVDHIVPHRGDMQLFWLALNWQPLCKSCHDRKTVTEDGGFGNARVAR